ncbi:RluA family pseudouridine synthase [Polaribacter sp. MSW13]|uniref:RluA family pseudouridine synthase n=1 Tax=Polaribacter marinus TaxID=2916838 RepID=A0A9X2AKK7_9FLAO|nr:RluA family pseudouridine synthase [Polaribacter marinus]MCI2229618.1 RluA family pseudouridine synthase [Polaribacter marinus]
MQLIETHIVPKLEKSIRLQEYAVGIFKILPTKSGIKKAIKKELILVDGKTTSTAQFINGRETIELFQPKESVPFKRFKLELEILFEDDFLAIIYKPSGILVSGNSFATIDNALPQNLQKSTQTDAVRPRPIHRLDYPTSGLLLVGKTNSTIISLNKLFEKKEIQKTYHAITICEMNSFGFINFTIDDKNAQTEYEVLKSVISKRFGYLNLIQLKPKTGRKHQLRKHLLAIGNPILGDKEYYKENLILNGKGLYLHASSLEFIHPHTTEKITITKELPKKFTKIFPEF